MLAEITIGDKEKMSAANALAARPVNRRVAKYTNSELKAKHASETKRAAIV
jgi:hypothetical protein